MRPIAAKQNIFEFPMNFILGTEAKVRLLRLLCNEVEGPVSITEAANRTGLTVRGAKKALQRLVKSGVVQAIGGGRNHLFGLQSTNDLVDAIRNLFKIEKSRYAEFMQSLQSALENLSPPPISAWVQEWPGKLEDPLLIGILQESPHLAGCVEQLRGKLGEVEKKFNLTIEINGYARADLTELKPQAIKLLYGFNPFPEKTSGSGKTPDKNHQETDQNLKTSAAILAEMVGRDPSMVLRAKEHINKLLTKNQGAAAKSLVEWKVMLDSYPVPRLARFLSSSSARAERLRQSNPFLAVLSDGERDKLTAKEYALNPPWVSSEIQGESLFFINGAARLLFSPASKVSISSSDGSLRYEENKDFIIEKEGRLRLLPGSRIPTTASKDLFIPATSDSPDKYAHKRGDPSTWMLWSEKGLYHKRQVIADYSRAGKWDLFTPKFEGERLKRTISKLARREPLTVAVSGDSISAGYNASKSINLPPFQPCYAELLTAALEKHYNGKVMLKNFAVGGWTSAKGLEDAPKRAEEKPDLVIIAYGMNDAGFEQEVYRRNIAGIKEAFAEMNQEAEFILVATMLPNPEWKYPEVPGRFEEFRRALLSLEGPGTAVADMTSLWRDLMTRKTHYDLTGNGLNHPNDFSHRLYAWLIRSTLLPE